MLLWCACVADAAAAIGRRAHGRDATLRRSMVSDVYRLSCIELHATHKQTHTETHPLSFGAPQLNTYTHAEWRLAGPARYGGGGGAQRKCARAQFVCLCGR